ncbi:forkhead box protein N1 isoform X2 [Oryzias melastigma]|uniref:Forkhead box N1 n=2 Tax=Oryzias melastigma TaxID=30732 RepID=A0A3B3CEM1_ORYME|nr:forkhead box protein N1 isoform X2 [Oryzias melastigma]
MSQSPTFSLGSSSSSSSSKCQASAPQTRGHRDACFPEQESTTFHLRTPTLTRQHSADGTIRSESESAPERGPVNRFHPYRRQFSDGAMEAAGFLHQCSSAFNSLQEVCSPEVCLHSSDVPTTWNSYSSSTQGSFSELPATQLEPTSFQRHPSYGSLSPLQQVQSKLYPNGDHPNSSKYGVQTPSSQTHQETQSSFPKPIYSYSILIFMALKNSKTGSLPVSEIYSFMTEHFPYFKTAPDGWKNSVRHNLSLNKCFEKVENKNGSASRKGCLWALNPAKVEKMQEELHKWRRKDPMTIRRSMARPEDLDHLVGEKPDKFRRLPPYTSTALLSRVAPLCSTTSPTSAPTQFQPTCHHTRSSQYSHIQPQQPYYLPPTAAHPSNSFALYSPCEAHPAAGVPAATGSLNSPIAGKMPPVFNAALQAEYSVSPRGMQDLLLEGDASYDIDALNPSLTDLQLHGNVWEELRDDSLESESHVATATSSATFLLQDHCPQAGFMQVPSSFSHNTASIPAGRCKAEYEDRNTDRSCWNGLHPVAYSGVESLAGYLTSCTTSLSLV